MSLIDLVQQHLGPAELQQISQQLGVDPTTAQQAVQTAVPSLVAGMAGQAQQAGGASSIESLLGAQGGGGGGSGGAGGLLGSLGNPGNLGGLGNLSSLGSMIGGASGGAEGGLLGSLLGHHESTVNDHVQQATGLDAGKSQQLLTMLAPIVLAALMRHRASSAAGASAGSPSGLSDVLVQEAQQAQQTSPGMGGLLGKILSLGA